MKKKITALISFIILIVVMFLAVMIFKTDSIIDNTEKIQIVATLFPQYDFAKHIVGDKANVKLLLNSGIEAHNYEPTAKDMITLLNNTDIFLYNGEMLEPWTAKLVSNLDTSKTDIINLSENVKLIKIEDFEAKYLNSEIIEDEEEHDNEEIYDEHIWLNADNAIIMIDEILEEICLKDPLNKEYYIQNANEYKNSILKQKEELSNIINNSSKKILAFGGEFAYSYLINDFDLQFASVYTNCGEGEDPSIARIKSVIDYINKYDLKVVFYEELSEGTVAKMIAEETSAKPVILYSIHNGNVKEDTYISLMQKNIEAIKMALED